MTSRHSWAVSISSHPSMTRHHSCATTASTASSRPNTNHQVTIYNRLYNQPQISPSPEYSKNSWGNIDVDTISCVDVWMLACLIYELYNGKYNGMEDLKKVGNIPKSLLPTYQQMLHSNPSNRCVRAEFRSLYTSHLNENGCGRAAQIFFVSRQSRTQPLVYILYRSKYSHPEFRSLMMTCH